MSYKKSVITQNHIVQQHRYTTELQKISIITPKNRNCQKTESNKKIT